MEMKTFLEEKLGSTSPSAKSPQRASSSERTRDDKSVAFDDKLSLGGSASIKSSVYTRKDTRASLEDKFVSSRSISSSK
jgi:hypothetical protein